MKRKSLVRISNPSRRHPPTRGVNSLPDNGDGEIARNAPPASDELSDQEREDFERHRKRFKDIARIWIEVGDALRDIRDRRLYRGQFATFEDFCRTELGMGRSNLNRQLRSTQIAKLLATNVATPLREAHVRPLLRLEEPEQQMEAFNRAMAQAKEKKKPFTAAFVTRAVNGILDAEKPGDIAQKPVTKDELITRISRYTTRDLEKLPLEMIEEFEKAVAKFKVTWLNAHASTDSATAVAVGGNSP